MQNPEELTAAERELESALRGLRPAGTGIDRDALMFAAGQAAGRIAGGRGRTFWQASTGLLAVALGAVLLHHPAGPQVARVVPPDRASISRATAPAGPGTVLLAGAYPRDAAYLHLRERVLREGLDALPSPPSGGGGDSPDALLRPFVRSQPVIPVPSYLSVLTRLLLPGESP